MAEVTDPLRPAVDELATVLLAMPVELRLGVECGAETLECAEQRVDL
jgi:hypothetical protein